MSDGGPSGSGRRLRGAAVALILFALAGLISGCAGSLGESVSTAVSLTAADRTYLAELRNANHFSVTTANEERWLGLGHGVCRGVESKGVSKYMAEISVRDFRAILIVAPKAIAAYCPQQQASFGSWLKARG